jgi:hypothetical protein
MLRYALKEWAVICQALAAGRQAILLRKGGIAEEGGDFRLEQRRFWLFPTFVHQQQNGIIPEARPLLHEAEAAKPPAGVLRLENWGEVVAAYHVQELDWLLRFEDLHCWSEETVRSRFAYRRPGLHVLAVRVSRMPKPIETVDRPEFAGCHSWVDLGEGFSTEGATPVLNSMEFDEVLGSLARLLREDVIV